MDEITFKRLALWQAEAATIPDSFERCWRATLLFEDLPGAEVYADGSVTVPDPTKSQTFGEPCLPLDWAIRHHLRKRQ